MLNFVELYLEFMDFLDVAVRKVLVLLTGLMTLTVILQVLFRYILENPLVWTEELARYLMIWMSFTGASCVIKRWDNIFVDVLVNRLKHHARAITVFIHKVIVFLLLLAILYLCVAVIPDVAGSQVTAAMGVSMLWPQSALIVGLLLMVMQNMGAILRDIYIEKVFRRGDSK